MVLMKPGCWHDTVWADRTWHEDLWLEYGTAAPPAPPTEAAVYAAQRRIPLRFIRLLRDYVETLEVSENG